FLPVASQPLESSPRFRTPQASLLTLAQLLAPTVRVSRSRSRFRVPAWHAKPLSQWLPEKKQGQAIVECAAEDPMPVPRPGGRLCDEKRRRHPPRHTRREFAPRANTFCSHGETP